MAEEAKKPTQTTLTTEDGTVVRLDSVELATLLDSWVNVSRAEAAHDAQKRMSRFHSYALGVAGGFNLVNVIFGGNPHAAIVVALLAMLVTGAVFHFRAAAASVDLQVEALRAQGILDSIVRARKARQPPSVPPSRPSRPQDLN